MEETINKTKKAKKKKRITIGLIIIAILLCLFAGVFYYLNDSYPASDAALELLEDPDGAVTITEEDGEIVFAPEDPVAGIIFYPGAKVDYQAYAPLMEKLAESKIFCVLVEMPFNIAIFDKTRADRVKKEFPEITRWYMAGHSLGGAMAADYISSHADEYEGLILLAAYSLKDLSKSNLKTITIYGSEDGVLNRKKFKKCLSNLPEDNINFEIDGGCHAYFGDYGDQRGDGSPTINREEQMDSAVDGILMLIEE